MSEITSQPPHVIAGFTVPRIMFQVLAALLPVLAVQVYLFGTRTLLLVVVAAIVALACEALHCACGIDPSGRSCATAACS